MATTSIKPKSAATQQPARKSPATKTGARKAGPDKTVAKRLVAKNAGAETTSAKRPAAKKAGADRAGATKAVAPQAVADGTVTREVAAGRAGAKPGAAKRTAAAGAARQVRTPGKAAPRGTASLRAPAGTGAADRLDLYRNKRDFDVTPEPSGAVAPARDGHRFVVQRHRATRLHYDLRLEAAGVLLSWAVPKGPTLDPDVKRMAVHVEDHPLEYFDFEGVIPAGEYGGGDVIVWDWGTWTLADGDDPIAAVEAGDLHVDLHGEKLRGRFVLVRRGPPGPKEQWLLLHKHDDAAVPGWDPEEHPASVKTGRTNDEVKAAPAASWSSSALWVAPTPDELAALDAIRTSGDWQLGDVTLRLTNLDKVLFPADAEHPEHTKRDLVRHYASMAPVMLPYLVDRPINMHRYPDGIAKKGFWHKAAPTHAPDWLQRWRNVEADAGETELYLVLDSPAALAWAANFGAIELHPWTSTVRDAHRPTWAMIDIDPGESSTFDDVLVLARLHRTALEHLGVQAAPKVTGQRGVQIWVPVADGYTFDETRAWVEKLSAVIGRTVPDLISWEWEVAKRKGLIRLDYTQNAINKTLVAPFSVRPAAGAPVSVPISWDELDDPGLRPDRWDIRTIANRLRSVGDPLAPLIGLQQRLPQL
jgi:bifunctional non-homologous end joining protein LigD